MKNKKLKKINGAGQTEINMADGASVSSANIIDNSKVSREKGGTTTESSTTKKTTLMFGGINLGGN